MNPLFPKIGDISSVPETTYGFRTKLLYFIDRIEFLRRELKGEKRYIRILDVGCGNGVQMTFPLGAQGYAVTGIDMHESSIQYAKSQNSFTNVEFWKSDIKNLKEVLNGQKFDAVVLSDILEHIENPSELLKHVAQVLKPHGIILISIPNGYGPFEIENFVLRKTGVLAIGRRLLKREKDVPYNHESGHIQFFTRRRIHEMAEAAKLSVSDFRKGCFLGGSASNFVISRVPALVRANIRLGRHIPAFLCSVWYFELRGISSSPHRFSKRLQ